MKLNVLSLIIDFKFLTFFEQIFVIHKTINVQLKVDIIIQFKQYIYLLWLKNILNLSNLI